MLNLATMVLGVDGGFRGKGGSPNSPGLPGLLPARLKLLLHAEHLGRGELGMHKANLEPDPKCLLLSWWLATRRVKHLPLVI